MMLARRPADLASRVEALERRMDTGDIKIEALEQDAVKTKTRLDEAIRAVVTFKNAVDDRMAHHDISIARLRREASTRYARDACLLFAFLLLFAMYGFKFGL